MGTSNGKKSGGVRRGCCSNVVCNFLWSLLVIFLVSSNWLVLYTLTSSSSSLPSSLSIFSTGKNFLNLGDPTTEISDVHHELKLAQIQLAGIRNDVSAFLERLRASDNEKQKQQQPQDQHHHHHQHQQQQKSEEEEENVFPENVNDDLNLLDVIPSSELHIYTETKKLPRGHHVLFDIEKMVSSVGHSCTQSPEMLQSYMDYQPGELCPDDSDLAQSLMIKGCEPLPRRRCLSRTPPTGTSTPLPYPDSMWTLPNDSLVLWTHYGCQSFECLNNRSKQGVFEDCLDCFDIQGVEKSRWIVARNRHDFLVDRVLESKKGSIRIGLDLGGGSGSFAARMRERNVTIVTSTLNLNGPFNEFIGLRGLIPMHITVAQRLPFFDNSLDIVHSMHVLSNWLPTMTLEFLLYDIDRVLRPGGLFWLDRFFCTKEQLDDVYVPMIQRMGYEKMRWSVGVKTDKVGHDRNQVYLSALLEKPVRAF